MEPIEFLYLSQQDVVDTGVSFADAVVSAEEVLREHGAKAVENPPKPGVHPGEGNFLHAMPAYLGQSGRAGLKWVSGFFDNPARGLPSIMALIVLNDVETGRPLAVMDGTYVTGLRTAAVSAVAAKHLANADARVIGLVGAGLQGRYHLLTLKDILGSVETVHAYDIDEAVLERFVAEMGPLVPFAIEPGESGEDVIRGADIVITAASALSEVIFLADWVAEGALVLPVHSKGWERAMIERADRFIVDDWGQFATYLGPPGGFYETLPEAPDAELGEVVAGLKPGREAHSQRILSFNPGLAMQDVGLASVILARARERGLGQRLTLTDRGLPFS